MIAAVDLACNEDFLSGDDPFFDRTCQSFPHAGLVLIVTCRVNETHAGFQCIVCGILRFFIGKCPGTCPNDGHLPAAVEQNLLCLKIKFANNRTSTSIGICIRISIGISNSIRRSLPGLIRTFRLCFIRRVIRHDFAGPVNDSAELIDVGISHIKKLLGCLLAAVTAPAVDQDDLIKVRKFFRLLCSNAFIRNTDGSGDMAGIIFLLCPHIHNNLCAVLLHHLLCFFLGDLRIAADHIFPVHNLSTGRASRKQKYDCHEESH